MQLVETVIHRLQIKHNKLDVKPRILLCAILQQKSWQS
jgi:hypothetical protein